MTESDTYKKEIWAGIEDPIQLLALAGYKHHWGNVSTACQLAGISRTTFYRWKHEVSSFDHALEDIEQQHLEMAKAKLKEMAIINGNITALIFYLKNKAPDEYRDRHANEVPASMGLTGLEGLTDEELEARIKECEEKKIKQLEKEKM